MTWCFFLGAGPLRGLVEKQLERKNYDLPSLSRTNALRLTLIVRLTPALPFLFQNYFLGFMRVPFRTFILVSASVHTMYAVGFVIFGGSIFQGKAGVAVIALMVIVVAILLARMLYGWLRRREALRMGSASCANEASPVGNAEGGGGGDA
jgi:uncharacterized membrane protein YdjX (TVP38/TMEM64 family)